MNSVPRINAFRAKCNWETIKIVNHWIKEEDEDRVVLEIQEADTTRPIRHFFEDYVQRRAEDKVLQYWRSQGGRQNATNLDKFHVFRILDHKGTARKGTYKVQWVGYSADDADTTWEAKSKVRGLCICEVERYEESLERGEEVTDLEDEGQARVGADRKGSVKKKLT